MDELTLKKTTPAVLIPQHTPRKRYVADGKDRFLLPGSWALGTLAVCAFGWGMRPGLGVTLLAAAWYALLFWYKGRQGLGERINMFLLVAILLLALTFCLYSNLWLRGWNLLFLLALVTVQLFQWSGQGNYPWTSPMMLAERLCLLLDGLFCRLPASWDTARSYKSDRRVLSILAGLGLTTPLLLAALFLLREADPYFALVTGKLLRFLVHFFGRGVVRLLLGLALAPFLFGLFYTLRRPEKAQAKELAFPGAEPLLPAVVLLVMDLLYAFFLIVQFTALFGGPAYLERVSGLSYAEYARSGFFQLVFVAILNLSLVLGALQLAKREGAGWRGLRVLATLLIVMSGVILGSAAYRMGLYVSAYGLSFKRLLTYWGMGMLAIFFSVSLLKVWKRDVGCFKVFFAVAVAGWLVLNYVNPDRLVAWYNVSLYQQNQMAMIDLDYLANGLSFDTLSILKKLPEDTRTQTGRPLREVLSIRKEQAKQVTAHWQNWSLSAALAASK